MSCAGGRRLAVQICSGSVRSVSLNYSSPCTGIAAHRQSQVSCRNCCLGPQCHTFCTPAPTHLAYLTDHPHAYSCRLSNRGFARSQHVPNCSYRVCCFHIIVVNIWRVLNMHICDGCRKVGSMLTVRFEDVLMSFRVSEGSNAAGMRWMLRRLSFLLHCTHAAHANISPFASKTA